jgi:hypothetical protein
MRRGTDRGLRIIRVILLTPALALLAAACTSSGTTVSGEDPSFMARFRSAMGSGSAQAQAAPPGQPALPGSTKVLESCPNIELRQGTGTLTINNNPKDQSAMQLRYQVAVMQTARECSVTNGTLSIRIGVQGRVVLGPAGTHGSLEIPLRYALVEEGPDPKTLYTKLHRIPVAIPEGAPNVAFTHIEETISVPMPSIAVFDKYVVYVGFDALGAAQDRKPAPKKRTPKQS